MQATPDRARELRCRDQVIPSRDYRSMLFFLVRGLCPTGGRSVPRLPVVFTHDAHLPTSGHLKNVDLTFANERDL